MKKIRFYGTKESVEKWREIVMSTTNKYCSEVTIREDVYVRYTFDTILNQDDINTLMSVWYETNEITKRPWNESISFLEIK